jgi:SAM-dependent methyltransferase
MARRLEAAAQAAVDVAAIAQDDRVLDVATATGNAALLAARRQGQVTAVDFEPALLRLAERRASEAGLSITWLAGDATALPVPDHSADVVLSVFGVMYASDHQAAARELARVCAPGGRLVLTAWTPGSLMPTMGQVLGRYLPPPPPGSGPPSRWGGSRALDELLTTVGLTTTTACPRHLRLTFPDDVTAAEFLVSTAGHAISEKPRLVAEHRWTALMGDMNAFVVEYGARHGGEFHLSLEYLLVTAEV